jgi:hypothetical protein
MKEAICSKHIDVMIFQTMYGTFWNLTFLGEKVFGEGGQKTIGCLLTQYSGFFGRGLHGEICLPTMGIGKIHTAGSVGGVIEGSGKNCWGK